MICAKKSVWSLPPGFLLGSLSCVLLPCVPLRGTLRKTEGVDSSFGFPCPIPLFALGTRGNYTLLPRGQITLSRQPNSWLSVEKLAFNWDWLSWLTIVLKLLFSVLKGHFWPLTLACHLLPNLKLKDSRNLELVPHIRRVVSLSQIVEYSHVEWFFHMC